MLLRDPVVSKFLCPVAHLPTRDHSKRVEVATIIELSTFHECRCEHICGNDHAVGKRTVYLRATPSKNWLALQYRSVFQSSNPIGWVGSGDETKYSRG